MGLGDHPKTFLLKALSCQSAPSWLKVMGGCWWVGGTIVPISPAMINPSKNILVQFTGTSSCKGTQGTELKQVAQASELKQTDKKIFEILKIRPELREIWP